MKNSIFIDNSILIIPNNIKKNILFKLNDEVHNIKLMSLNEFINLATFSYDEKSIIFLIEKYNLKYDAAIKYLSNLKYLNKNNYKSKKLNFLLEIKKDLDENNLLIYDDLFLNLVKGKKIIVYGYDYIDKFSYSILKKFDASIIEKESNNYEHDIYEFNSIDEEVEFVLEKICDLINDGISINNIKLANINEEYFNVLNRLSSHYNLNINVDNSSSIYSTNIVKDFFLNLNSDINITLEYISKKYDLSLSDNLYIFNQLIKVLNKYYFIDDYLTIKDVLEEELKRIKLKKNKYQNAIEVIDIRDNIINDDDYVFLLSFNQTIIPKIYKDEDYLSDKDKEEIDLEKSYEKNKLEKDSIIKSIKNIKNLYITYKLHSSFNSYFKSSLIDELNYEIIVNPKIKHTYSNLSNKINLTKKLDDYVKYGTKDDELSILFSKYSDISYRTFDNKFKGINTFDLEKLLNNKLTLSYSSMSDYYKCSYRYYIKNILKIDKYEETFDTFLGNLFHYILSICFNENFNFEEEFNNYIKDKEFSFKDKFYLNKLKEDLKFIIKTIKEQYSHISLDKSLYEDEIFVNFDGTVKVTFKGFIDKILYKEVDNITYAVIIDYKTGNPELGLENSIYGLNLQLPVYLYLARNSKKLNNVKVLGFYLQKILDMPNKTKGKTLNDVKRDNLKLLGYSISDEKLLAKIDDSYEKSEIIKSLAITKNGFYSYSKVLTEKQIDSLYNLTERKINESIENIRNGNFEINPKKIGDKNYGCEFCKYKDICYRTNNDIVNLKQYKNLDFLGGEDNAKLDK